MRTAMAKSADLLHVTMMKTEMMVAEEDLHHVTAIMKMAIGEDPHHVMSVKTKRKKAAEDADLLHVTVVIMKMAIGEDPHHVTAIMKMAIGEDPHHVTSGKTKRKKAAEDADLLHVTVVIMRMAIGEDPHHVTRVRAKRAEAGEDPAPLDVHPEINARIVRDYKCHKSGRISLNIVMYQSTFTVCFLFYKHDKKFCKHKCSAKFLLLNHYYLF